MDEDKRYEEELSEDEIEAQRLLEADGMNAGGREDSDADAGSAGDTGDGSADESADDGADGSADDAAEEPGTDSRLLQMYLDEIQEIEPISEKELAILLKKAHDGDLTARNRIVEGHLRYALSILWEYLNKGVELTELISEANVALIGAVDGFAGGSAGELQGEIAGAVRSAAARLIEEDGQISAENEDLAARVNELSDLSVEMVQELGRRPTNAELAHRLNVSEDVVESLIRMSIDAL
jgi:RNA polymerase primary sigma factor